MQALAGGCPPGGSTAGDPGERGSPPSADEPRVDPPSTDGCHPTLSAGTPSPEGGGAATNPPGGTNKRGVIWGRGKGGLAGDTAHRAPGHDLVKTVPSWKAR